MEYVDFYKEFGPLGYLANYSNHGFYKDGIYYKTVEHYYQSKKFDNIEIINKIINAETPKEASNIGRDRGNIRIDNFKSIKNSVMFDGIYEKFSQNTDIRNKLIQTGNAIIREKTIDEYYWGVGKDLSGSNNIGRILMNVREVLKKELLDKMINNCTSKKVCVLVPNNSSSDSMVAGSLLVSILKSRGIDCYLGVREEDTNSDLSFDYTLIDDYNDKYFFLVNHNNLNGISKDNIVGCIDHNELVGEIDDIISICYDSCSLVIYDLFNNTYMFSTNEKSLILETLLININ